MKYCSNCGSKLNEGQKFCPNCGNSLEESKKEVEKEVKEEVKEEEVEEVETPVVEQKVSTPATPPKKDKKTLIIILVSLFLIAAIISGAIFAVQYFDENSGGSSTTSSSKSKNKDKDDEEDDEKKTDSDKKDDKDSTSDKKPSKDDDEKEETKTVSCSVKEKEDNVDEEVVFDVKFKGNEPISGSVDVTFDFSAYSSSEMEEMLGEITSDSLCSMFTEAFTSSMGIDSDEADEYVTSCKSSTSGSKYKLGMDINMSKIYKAAEDKSKVTPENLKTALQSQGFSCKIK